MFGMHPHAVQGVVGCLADEAGRHRTLVLVLAYCGLRWGEVIALRVRDVELLRRRLAVSENAVQLSVNHALGPTKGREARSVPAFVLDELSVQCRGKALMSWCSRDPTDGTCLSPNPPEGRSPRR